MPDHPRRRFLKLAAHSAGMAAVLSTFPASIRRALALPAVQVTGTIQDIQHIVVLMLENRSFDHYFGTLRGVRGFADRHPIPLPNGKPVWAQSDGAHEIPPFRLDTRTTSALRISSTPHTFPDAQGAWNQGLLNLWPKFKTPISMGHYHREDIPFQFALAEAFTLCDAHHCSVTTGTDPNRIVFWSGSNYDPERRREGKNCTAADAEVNNLRCEVTGSLPTPGYQYQGSAFTWPTLPELLEQAGISWRIYQDPNDNWTGLMHGGLAFKTFRDSQPGTPLYEKGMSHWSLQQLAVDARNGNLPQVSWVLPPMLWSEHPAPSSPLQGAEFTAQVLEALTADPHLWGKTALFLTFDENDGLFDHVPPPAPPSYNLDGTLAGKSTLDLTGEYLSDPERKYLHPEDRTSGTVRPWGLGPRVPLYVISPWSRGGWVNSQVFDHTSLGQFLEKRFGITVPAISPWHRVVSGDLTSAFDFATPNANPFPELPPVANSSAVIASISTRPQPASPVVPERLFQEPGVRRSRALPYELHVHAAANEKTNTLVLSFHNSGQIGAVLHVYDKLHLDRIPRRYTVESGKTLTDNWRLQEDEGRYDLWVYGPNGFIREFLDSAARGAGYTRPEINLQYDVPNTAVRLIVTNHSPHETTLTLRANAYGSPAPRPLRIAPGRTVSMARSVIASHNWYDFTVGGEGFEQRFAGRMETGQPSYSDPAV
jgi:phospholipase C